MEIALPQGWQIKPLGELVEFLDHMRVPVKEAEREKRHGPYPYYGANGQIDWIDGYIFDEPLVLLAEDGGFFGSKEHPIAYKIEGKSWVNNHAHVLRPLSKLIDINYLHWFLSFMDVRPFLSGSTRAKLTKSDASKVPVIFPKGLDSQKRIAQIIERANSLKKKREQANQLSNKIIPLVFLKMFTKVEYEKHGLGNICQVMDVDHKMPRKQSSGVPIVSTGELTKGSEIDFTSAERISEQDYLQQAKKCTPQKGDVLFSRYGTVGVARMVRTDNKFAISYSICIIRPTKGVIPEYVEALMNSDLVQTQAKTATIGIAIPDLGLKEIRSFEVPVPPLREQLQFRSLVDRIKKIVDDQTESTEEINELFYSLMYKAFRGDLV